MDFSNILNEYPYTTELHAHSFPASSCGDFSPAEVVELYKAAGVTSLVLTNHLKDDPFENSYAEYARRYLADYEEAKRAAGDELNVILGAELRFTENCNDYLIFGIEEDDIERLISLTPYGIENFYKNFKNERNVIIQAHPLRKNMVLAPVNSIDGIESMNMHPNHHAKPSVAFKYAKENNLLVSGGTDFHHKGHQALCLMRTQNEMKSSYDVAEALKSKKAIFDCSGHIIIPYIY